MSHAFAARVLAISGSDSGGGAGMQADLKTITMAGGHASSALTAITAQNTLGVDKISLVPPALVQAQIRAVLDDIGADTIKIGMLGSVEIIEAVAIAIQDYPARIVLDPVMVAKGGTSLLQDTAASALHSILMPMAYLLTPNIPEAQKLSGRAISSLAEMRESAEQLQEQGAQNVLVKGGHLPGESVVDFLLQEQSEAIYESPKIHSRHTHGTGCTLASAIATHLAQGQQLDDAVRLARKYVQGAIYHAPGLGGGHGPMHHGWPLAGKK